MSVYSACLAHAAQITARHHDDAAARCRARGLSEERCRRDWWQVAAETAEYEDYIDVIHRPVELAALANLLWLDHLRAREKARLAAERMNQRLALAELRTEARTRTAMERNRGFVVERDQRGQAQTDRDGNYIMVRA